MNKLRLIILTTMTCLVSSCSFGGNSKKEDEEQKDPPKTVDCKIWTATGTEKIRKDVTYNRTNSILKISAFKNEYESGQIILSPTQDVTYTIILNDLKSTNGDILSKNCFTVYNEKYANITKPYAASQHEQDLGLAVAGLYEGGWFPDALLPMDVAVSYSENKVKSGDNQGIWITLKTDKNQKAGTYKGNFNLLLNGVSKEVPVTIEIYDFALDDSRHMKTSFGFSYSGLDDFVPDFSATQKKDLFFKCRDELFNYRIDGGTSPGFYSLSSIDGYLDNLTELVKDVRCSNTSLLWNSTENHTAKINANGIVCIDNEVSTGTTTVSTLRYNDIEKVIYKIFERSIKERINLFSKMAGSYSVFDEADASSNHTKYNNMVYSMRRLMDLTSKIASIIEDATFESGFITFNKNAVFNDEKDNCGIGYELKNGGNPYSFSATTNKTIFNNIKTEFAVSLRNYRPIQTLANLDEKLENNVKFSWCPTIYRYDRDNNLEKARRYAQKAGGDVWTYTAINPSKPYPSYHYNDDLISSRLLPWMMYKMDIKGLLYWDTTWSGGPGGPKYHNMEYYNHADHYVETVGTTNGGRNGDGFLIYPGSVYGIDGFVPSIRLMSIRDGNEDYELLYSLELLNKTINFDEKLEEMTSNLIDVCKIKYDANYKADTVIQNLSEVRNTLASLLNGRIFEE